MWVAWWLVRDLGCDIKGCIGGYLVRLQLWVVVVREIRMGEIAKVLQSSQSSNEL